MIRMMKDKQIKATGKVRIKKMNFSQDWGLLRQIWYPR